MMLRMWLSLGGRCLDGHRLQEQRLVGAELRSIPLLMSLTKMLNKTGPKPKPWGAALVIHLLKV